jgi:hypothetical protein
MHFDMKNIFKSSHNHIFKHILSLRLQVVQVNLDEFKLTLF